MRTPSATQRPVVRLVLLLGSLSVLTSLAIDMYLPGLPTIAQDLDASPRLVQQTLTVFILGLATGQVVVGPLSDAWGRRRLLLSGLAVYSVGSLVCAAAPTIRVLLAGRVVQSLGAASVVVLVRATARDRFDGIAMTRLFSAFMLVTGLGPILAPLIGAQLLAVASWRVIFLLLSAAGLLLLAVAALSLSETLPASQRQPLDLRTQTRVLARLVRDPPFVRYVLSGAFHFAALFAYITGSSFVLQEVYGLSAQQYSVVFSVNGLGMVLVSQLNGFLVGRVADEQTLLTSSLTVGAVGGLGAFTCAVVRAPLAPLLVCFFLVVSMLGPVFANSASLALSRHGEAAGTASSLMGLLQFGVAAVAGAVSDGASIVSMGATMCVATLAAVTVNWLGRPAFSVRRPSRRSPTAHVGVSRMSVHLAEEEA